MRIVLVLVSTMLIICSCSNQTSVQPVQTTLSQDEVTGEEKKTVEEESSLQKSRINMEYEENVDHEANLVNEKWEGVTTERVKFRAEPSQDGTTQDVNYLNLQYTSFLKGTILTVLGRSELKEQIDDSEEYWYYVQYLNGEDTQYGWVYGAFIEKLDVESNYVLEFQEEINWLIASCGSKGASIPENGAELEKVVKGLIKRNAESIYIFKTTTLPFEPEVDINGGTVIGPKYPVTSDQFKSFQDLEAFLYSTYVKEYADHMLYTWEEGEHPLYLDVNGQLCVDSNYAGARGYYVDWDHYTIEISNVGENQADLKIFLIKYSPGSYGYLTISGKLIKENDQWLLEKMLY